MAGPLPQVARQSQPSGAALPHGWLALCAMALLLVAIGVDLTILNVALPSLAVHLGATSTDLQWFVNAYALVMAATLLPAGALGDRYGPRRLVILAASLFGVASAVPAWEVPREAGEHVAGISGGL